MSRPLDHLLVGRLLAGRYEIVEPAGRGGMSVVYRGVDRRLGRPVAVKLIDHSGSDPHRAHLRERFRREAAAAARIPPHPNVVQLLDYGTDPELDADFLVMELLRGRDLKAVLARGPLPLRVGARVLLEAARGVAAGHRVGIVHRDVKPANVFLVGEEEVESVRVLDFGIAKALAPDPEEDDLTVTGHAPHSPAYASPEQLGRGGPVTPASDVYQLGLVAYEVLTGERPFDEAARERIRAGEAVRVRGGPRWEAVPAPLRAVVEKALRAHPEGRFPDAAELAQALAAAAEDDRTHTAAPPSDPDATLASPPSWHNPPVPSPVPPPGGPPRRERRTGALWAAGIALLLLAGVWGLTRPGGDSAEEPGPTAGVETVEADDEALRREFEALEVEAAEELMGGR